MDGRLTFVDLKKYLVQTAEGTLDETQIEQMYFEIDKNGDGSIDKQELFWFIQSRELNHEDE